MHTQTIKCVFNRIAVPKLLGLVKFRLTNFLKDSVLYLFFLIVLFRKKFFTNTQEFCVLGSALVTALFTFSSCWFFFCFVFFLPGLLSDSS